MYILKAKFTPNKQLQEKIDLLLKLTMELNNLSDGAASSKRYDILKMIIRINLEFNVLNNAAKEEHLGLDLDKVASFQDLMLQISNAVLAPEIKQINQLLDNAEHHPSDRNASNNAQGIKQVKSMYFSISILLGEIPGYMFTTLTDTVKKRFGLDAKDIGNELIKYTNDLFSDDPDYADVATNLLLQSSRLAIDVAIIAALTSSGNIHLAAPTVFAVDNLMKKSIVVIKPTIKNEVEKLFKASNVDKLPSLKNSASSLYKGFNSVIQSTNLAQPKKNTAAPDNQNPDNQNDVKSRLKLLWPFKKE